MTDIPPAPQLVHISSPGATVITVDAPRHAEAREGVVATTSARQIAAVLRERDVGIAEEGD